MNQGNDPVRWREPGSGVPDGIRDVIGSAALDDVSGEQLSRFVERAQATLGGPAAAGAGRAALTSGKVAVGVALVGGAVLAWLLWGRAPAEGQAAGRRRAPAATVEEPGIQMASAPAEPASRPAEVASPLAEPPVSAAPARQERTQVSPRPAAQDTLAEEVRLLQGAREALAGDPAGALRLAEQHRSRFPRGTLSQEREVIAIDALNRQGRAPEAQARADRFRERYPRSSHLDRLSNLRDNRD